MRKRFEIQYELGSTPIEEVNIPTNSRDELPPVLRALQYIYSDERLNREVFNILEQKIEIKKTGKEGMSLWEILVLGTVRLTLDSNYDRLKITADYNSLVRDILGIRTDGFGEKKFYGLTTLKDNISLVDKELLEEINELVVKAGHSLVKKKEGEEIRAKIDSYVLETNVHFPTDYNLLWDSARKSVVIIEKIVEETQLDGWRKSYYWKRELSNRSRNIGNMSKRGGKNKEKRIKEAVRKYLRASKTVSKKIKETQEKVSDRLTSKVIILLQILHYYEEMLDKHIDLLERRIIKGATIPHSEKVFSIFEPHTEWINKGKFGKEVELGLRISIATDQYGFLLHHRVMEKEEDVRVAVEIGKRLIEKYSIKSISFDKGYWSNLNYEELKEIIDEVVMPKKGKLNILEQTRETDKSFKKLRKSHSAIESDINSLEYHGLNRCPDKGIKNFKKYVGLGVLSFNLHRLGNLLLERERKEKINHQKSRLKQAA